MKRDYVLKTFVNPPNLPGKRIVLRKMKKTDWRDMYEYASNPEVTRYLLWEPHPDDSFTKRYLEYLMTQYKAGDFFDWAIEHRADGKMIGTCGFTRFDFQNNSAEIGYVLNPAYWGGGYAAEAASLVLRFGFLDLNIHRIEARFMEGNERSRRVMEKIGMTFEGYHRSSIYVKNAYRTVGYCAITDDEFIGNKII